MKHSEKRTYFSNGNLLISGEYFVLTGAKAFAVPLKKGQLMQVEGYENNRNTIHWEAYEVGKPWFKTDYNGKNLSIINSNDIEKATWLQKVLKEILRIKPEIFKKNKSYHISCEIQFNTNWGWGSSATLISNLSTWAGIDPFELNRLVSSGSGYDIAASGSPSSIFYQVNNNKPEIIPVSFKPEFRNFIHFVYSGKKQNTANSIEVNLKSVIKNKNMIPVISGLTEKIAKEENLDEFMRYIEEHEKIISKTLKMKTIKERFFNGFEGEIKSLGAWGGDFVMVASHLDEKQVKRYFRDKGLETIFRFDEIVRN